MSTIFNMGRDINGYNAFAPLFSVNGAQTNLSQGVAQSTTVPSNVPQYIAVFSFEPGTSVWVANGSTATTPGGSFTTVISELNPASRTVKAGDVLSFISLDATAQVSVVYYSLPTNTVGMSL